MPRGMFMWISCALCEVWSKEERLRACQCDNTCPAKSRPLFTEYTGGGDAPTVICCTLVPPWAQHMQFMSVTVEWEEGRQGYWQTVQDLESGEFVPSSSRWRL